MDIVESTQKKEFENVLPLVNIVFLLLIFFMISGTFIKPEALTVDVPNAKLINPTSSEEIIIVMSESQFSIENQIYTQGEVIEFIHEKTDKENKPAIQLKIDQQAHSAKLLELMQELGNIGVSSIHLLTTKH